jgi:outer membrane autotransporter protein
VAGSVTVPAASSITTSGTQAVAIAAQSVGGPGGAAGDISKTLGATAGDPGTPGAVSVGGAGIWIDGGDNFNSIMINPGGSVSAAGLAIGTSGNYQTTITNSGTLTGSVNGTIRPRLNNMPNGVLNSGTELAADVTNQGLLVVSGPGSFGITTVRGDLAQTATGRLVFEADFGTQTADALIVTGSTTVAGAVRIVPRSVLPDRRIGLISLNGPVIDQTLEAERSSLFSYALTQAGNLVSVEAVGADFAPAGAGLSAAQSAVATGLQLVWDAGGNSTFGQIFAGLSAAADAGGSAYPRALDQLSPGASLALDARQSGEAHSFTNALLSCPDFAGTTAHVVETNCAWIRMIGRHTVNDGGGGVRGSTLNTMTWQIGGQQTIAPDLFLAGSLAFQTGWIGSSDSVVTGSGQSGFGGMALKWQPGPWLVAASVMGSYGSYRMSRVVALPGLGGVAKSNPDQSSVAGRLRAAYNVWDDAWYLRPMVSLDIVHARAPAYQETGPAAVSLSYATASQTGVIATPAIEVGRRFDLGEGATLRAYASLGMSFLSNPSWQVRTTFLGAPAGSGSFTTNLPGDRVLGRVSVGAQVLTADAFDLRAQYDGDYGGSMRSHAGTLTLAWRF